MNFHSDGFNRESHAAINVKIRSWGRDLASVASNVAENHGTTNPRAYMPMFDAAYIEEANGPDDSWWQHGLSDAWDDAGIYAREAFGPGYGVASEGRSGGWLIVTYHNRPVFTRDVVDGWDPEQRATWDQFEDRIKALVEEIPDRVASLIYINVYEPEADRREAAAEIAGPDPFGLDYVPVGPTDAAYVRAAFKACSNHKASATVPAQEHEVMREVGGAWVPVYLFIPEGQAKS
jgi:hypothetical protein